MRPNPRVYPDSDIGKALVDIAAQGRRSVQNIAGGVFKVQTVLLTEDIIPNPFCEIM